MVTCSDFKTCLETHVACSDGVVVYYHNELLPEHPNSPLVFSKVRVTRSLVLCAWFVDRCLSFCPFSFGHCVVCPSSIYGFGLPFGIFKLFLHFRST